jgi:hypothetical protein
MGRWHTGQTGRSIVIRMKRDVVADVPTRKMERNEMLESFRRLANDAADDLLWLALIRKESLFHFCPWLGRAANSVGVRPLRLVSGRLVL